MRSMGMKAEFHLRVRLVTTAVAVALCIVFAVCVPLSAAGGQVEIKRADSCTAEGLSAIPVNVRLFVTGRPELFEPKIRVAWSGSPLPASCSVRRRVAVDVKAWFSRGSGPIEVGPDQSGAWSVFWQGKKVARHESTIIRGDVFTELLGCIRKARGWLRYSVVDSGAHIEAVRTVSTPVVFKRCS